MRGHQFLCAIALWLALLLGRADAAPLFSVNDVTVVEGGVGTTVNADFTVTLSQAATIPASVVFSTAGVTAAAGTDFVSLSRVLSFPAGTTTLPVTVMVKGDARAEADETFRVTLSRATGGAGIARAVGTGTILDDDRNNDKFADARVIQGNSGTDAGNNSAATSEPGESAHTDLFYAGKSIWWRWTASSSGAVTANTFGSPLDDTILTVYTGDSIAHLALVTFSDDVSDTDHHSEVHFTAVAGTTYSFLVDSFKNGPVGGVQFSLVASVSSAGSSFSINDVAVTEGAAGGTVNATFTVQLTPAVSGDTTVDFDAVSDTATAGVDFVPQNRVLTFMAGATSQQVTVVVKGDAVAEVNETFFATLSHASGGARITKAIGIGTINDDDRPAGTNNDALANARLLTGDRAADVGNNNAATAEPGELVTAVGAGKTIWWQWTAAHAGTVTANTFGSAIDSVLSVFTGASVDHLVRVALNDDAGAAGAHVSQSEVRFAAKAGTTYSFAVDQFNGSPGNGGTVSFSLAAFPTSPVKFHGLIGPTSFDGTAVGSLDVTRTAVGGVRATGIFNAKAFAFNGNLDANGRAGGVIAVAGLGSVAVALSLDTAGVSEVATGTLTLGTAVAQIRLEQAAFSLAHPAPQAGAYTFAIPFDATAAPLAPRAHGSGTVTVSKAGVVHVAGHLGDGTPFGSYASLSASGLARCFTLLYVKKGSVSLVLDFTATATDDFTGTVRWAHPLTPAVREPQAFTAVLSSLGSGFPIPTSGMRVLPDFDITAGAGTATLTGGNLESTATPTITRGVNLGTTNKFMVIGSNESLAININLRNGLVTGSFKHPVTNRLVSFTGAALRKSSEIYGYFPGTDKYGALFVEPGP